MMHTKEPWSLFVAYAQPELRDASGKLIAAFQPEELKDARRIVACVNACAGISADALESEGNAVLGWQRTASKLVAMKQQRDKLLEALKALIELTDGERYDLRHGFAEADAAARQLIAELESTK